MVVQLYGDRLALVAFLLSSCRCVNVCVNRVHERTARCLVPQWGLQREERHHLLGKARSGHAQLPGRVRMASKGCFLALSPAACAVVNASSHTEVHRGLSGFTMLETDAI